MSHGSAFDGDYAPGATANAAQAVTGRMTGAAIAIIAAIALAVVEITCAIQRLQGAVEEQTLVLRERSKAQRMAVVHAPGPAIEDAAQIATAGRRAGESPEAWGRRIEAADIAAFKARNRP